MCNPLKKFISCIPVVSNFLGSLHPSPLNSGDVSSTYNPWGRYVQTYMSVSSEYANGVWTIKVNPAEFKYISDVKVNLYDAVGNPVAMLWY